MKYTKINSLITLFFLVFGTTSLVAKIQSSGSNKVAALQAQAKAAASGSKKDQKKQAAKTVQKNEATVAANKATSKTSKIPKQAQAKAAATGSKKDQKKQAAKTVQKNEATVAANKATSKTSKIPKNAYLIDETSLIVYGSEQDRILCRSEIDRLGIDGRKWTKQDLIDDELLFQETIKYRVPIDETVVDRYIATIQKDNNLDDEQVNKIFTNAGYTIKEGREQLKRMYASQMIIDSKIRSRLVVPEREVIAYYEANPIVKEAKYQLEYGFVPYERTADNIEKTEAIKASIKAGKEGAIAWRDPFWLKASELADSMKFVVGMQPGEISEPMQVAGGFELYRLKNIKPEHNVPLHKRYRNIVSILQRPKFEQMLTEYQQELLNSAFIVDYTVAPAVAS